jgi:hypothetical protein
MMLLNIPSHFSRGSKKNTSPVTSRAGSPKAMNESTLVLKASVNQVSITKLSHENPWY